MNKIEFDYEKESEGTYIFDGLYYQIQNENVFLHGDNGFEYTEDITANQLRFHGELMTDSPQFFELLIKDIKEIGNDTALIHADDGSDFDFWFVEDNYSEYKSQYEIGKKGVYRLFADILTSELPEDFRDGVLLEGDSAKKWFEWVGDEVEEGAVANVGFSEIAVYKETKDFINTGIYEFNAIVNEPGFVDNPGEDEGGDIFQLAIMNQFNKAEPRFITAMFQNPPYTFPKHESEEDDEDEMFCDGWALKGTMRFTVGRPSIGEPEEEYSDDDIFKFGSNEVTFPEAKGLCQFDDEDYLEDENGNRILNPEKYDKYFGEDD